MLLPELNCAGGIRRAKRFGPTLPFIQRRVEANKVIAQRLKKRRALQGVAPIRQKGVELSFSCFAGMELEPFKYQPECFQFQPSNARVVHLRRAAAPCKSRLKLAGDDQVASPGERELGDCLHVYVEDVEELAACRGIRAGMLRFIGEHLMQRIKAQDVATPAGRQLAQSSEVVEVTNSPVAHRAQQIQLQGNPPRSLSRPKGIWQITARWRYDETRASVQIWQFEFMIAERDTPQLKPARESFSVA